MKKSLLTTALLALVAATGLAQQKTIGNGVYYSRPEGTIYRGMNSEGLTLGLTWLVVPPFYEPVFKNQTKTPAKSDWYLFTDPADDTFVTDDGDFTFGTLGAYNSSANYYLPTLTYGRYEYTLGEKAKYFSENQSVVSVDTIGNKSFIDFASFESSAAWGKLDNGYALGTGTYTDDGRVWTSTGLAQVYPKPAAPLYIEEFHTIVFTASQPLKGDARLTLQLLAVEQNEAGEDVIGTEVLGTFYATAATATQVGEPFHPSESVAGTPETAYSYNLSFVNTTKDAFDNDVRIPAIVDRRFAIVITGVDQEGVDVDFAIAVENESDRQNSRAYGLLKLGDETSRLEYNSYISLNISFWGGFNHVSVNDKLVLVNGDGDQLTVDNANVLRVSDDGLELWLEGTPEGVNVNSAVALTAFSWYDEDDNPNYYAELPDWVVSMDADESLRYNYYRDADGAVYTDVTGREQVVFECEALPAGVEGRSAVIYIEGPGCKATTPIILLQGNATIAGISTPTVTHREAVGRRQAFNLSGQRVDSNYKGLVIKNGKKYLVK